jgi:hypothetical protein
MILRKQPKLKMAKISVLTFMAAWMVLHFEIHFSFDSDKTIGLLAASANEQYGIQGQQAPELNLATWIDGDGIPIDPINLNEYRGKVIYLYFFQDW